MIREVKMAVGVHRWGSSSEASRAVAEGRLESSR